MRPTYYAARPLCVARHVDGDAGDMYEFVPLLPLYENILEFDLQ